MSQFLFLPEPQWVWHRCSCKIKGFFFSFCCCPSHSPFLCSAQIVQNAASPLPVTLGMFPSPLFDSFHSRVKFPSLLLFLTAVTSWWVTPSEHGHQSWSLSVRKQQDPSSWELQHSRNWTGFCGQLWQKCCFLPDLAASHWGHRVPWQCVTQGRVLIYRALLDLSATRAELGRQGKQKFLFHSAPTLSKRGQ